MATDGNGFNGANKAKVAEQISNSANWTAYARVASVVSAPVGIVALALMAWNFSTLIELSHTATRTATQLEDFKDDAERSRNDTKDRMDRMTAWMGSLSSRIDDISRRQ